jgi:hypothetical protein
VKDESIKAHKFFVDANGLVMIERKNNWREDFTAKYNEGDGVPGNYFPMTSMSYIADDSRKMVVMTDRP